MIANAVTDTVWPLLLSLSYITTVSFFSSQLQGRDVGVSQITGFTAKISMGNGMQARSREVARLAQQLDFPRLLTFYYSSVGGFLTQCFLVRSSTILPSLCDCLHPISCNALALCAVLQLHLCTCCYDCNY
jgi:1,3-beta-glucan synthase component